MGILLERLADVCREQLLREKILVAPSLAIGHQIGDALAKGGTPWVNLRVETIRTIADAIASADLTLRGLTVLSRAQALALIERACDAALDATSYFAALEGAPGLYRAIQRSIDDLRHAGLPRDGWPSSAFEDARKASDLAAILAAYERELTERNYVDRFGVLARALELAAPRPDATWLVVDDVELSPAEERLLSRVSDGKFERLGSSTDIPAAEFVRAAGEENEVRGALRRLLRGRPRPSSPEPADEGSVQRSLFTASGVPHASAAPEPLSFDCAEIIYTARDPYLSLTYELVSEYAVPTTFAEGIAARYTRPGQACIGFLRWLADDCASMHLERVARAGAIRFGDAYEPLTPFAFARILRDAQIGWGLDRYLPRVAAHLRDLEARLEESDSDASRERRSKDVALARAARAALERITAVASEVATREVDSSVLARVVSSFLVEFHATQNEFDAMAFAALRRMLDELAALPSAILSLPAAAERLIEAIGATYVGASNPRPGHLHVASIRGGGWSGRAHVFVIGLDDAKHPGRGLQDPVVLDQERIAINETLDAPRLQLQGEAPVRASAQFRRLLGRIAEASVTLSWSELELGERRGGFSARDLLDVFRARHGSEATYEELTARATRVGFLESNAPLSESEWWMNERFTRHRPGLAAEVLATYPWLAAGARAEEARASDAITEWDGKIDVARDEIDPRRTGKVYSASQLEKMASCPYGWFLDRVLGIRPLEEMERVTDQWLNARDFGSMFHAILQRAMTEVVRRGEKPSPEKHSALFRDVALAEIETWRERVPIPSEAAFIRQRDDALDACEIFLRAEQRRAGNITPKYFEVPFGFEVGEGEAFGMEKPLVIPFRDGELRLRGRIDRVDRNDADGSWEVWDYKTGSLWAYRDSSWRLKQGTKVQHAVYARALTEMLRSQGIEEEVSCSGYYFPTRKGDGELNARDCDQGELEHALGLAFDVVGSGFFPMPADGECGFCDFKPICRGGAETMARMQRKLAANAEDPAVRAWQRLQEVK